MEKFILILIGVFISLSISYAQKIDFSVVSLPEETGLDLKQITSDNDYVCMPEVKRTRKAIEWFTNKIIAIPKPGDKIAFISNRNNTTNVFVKSLDKRGAALQRTNRNAVIDFSYSHDNKYIAFSEQVGKNIVIYQTDANNGFICRQITNANRDYSPIYSNDGKMIFFAREEVNSSSIWGYDIKNNFLSSYTSGLNPYPSSNNNVLYCIRVSPERKGEIWRVDFANGIEECIVSDINKSFSTPTVSPDGKWLVFVGSSIAYPNEGRGYQNTDIYVCRVDGTDLNQLTYHAADDLSPEWSSDGNYIYFISQRGSSEGIANVWRINFV